MNVGILLHRINPNYRGGVNSYILGLLEGIATVDKKNTYSLLVTPSNRHLFEKFEKENIFLQEIPFAIQKWQRVLVDYIGILPGIRIFFPRIYRLVFKRFIKFLDQSSVDVYYCPYELPWYSRKPLIVSIHDIQFTHFPQFFSLGQKWHRKIFYGESVKRAKVVQASSEFIKRDFIQYFGLNSEKVKVILDGVHKIFHQPISKEELKRVKRNYNLPKYFLFYPAQHWRHKNHLALIEALVLLKRKYQMILPLVCTGEINTRFQFLYDALERSQVKDQILFIGNVPWNDLPALYRLATVMVMPSLHESNSLTVMEAMKAGCAIAASDIEPNQEFNTNEALILFDPKNPSDIAEKILSLWTNEQLRLKKIQLGKKLAIKFNWQTTAKAYVDFFHHSKSL